MTTPFENLQATFCATLVDEWVRCGVRHVCVSPGSRSTPLVLALAEDGRIAPQVHLDERGAAFAALGIGMASGVPALVVTTSGTAATHLHGAVVEAHQARVPLIVCTADRPPALHHVGAPQTIEQVALFDGVTRWSADVGLANDRASGTWRSIAARSVLEASDGPVHLNLAFDEPLVGQAGDLPAGRADGAPWHRLLPAVASVDVADLESLVVGRRGVIVAGAGAGAPGSVAALAGRLGWPVLADPRSGCRGGSANAVAAFDSVIRALGDELRPEVVLRLGQPPASKVTAQWLASLDADQVLVDPAGPQRDPDRTAGTIVAAVPTAVCEALAADAAPCDDAWLSRWQSAERAAQTAIDSVLSRYDELTEPAVARSLTRVIPADGTLLVASSMPVRDIEWFGHPAGRQRVLSNRGANGIDGLIATALGVASASAPGSVVAHLGDLAFLHDSGSLLGAADRGVSVTFVVVDNDGGGIFSFLPQAKALPVDRFERFFGTPHGIDLAALAAVHAIPTTPVKTATDLEAAVVEGRAGGGVRLVLARTERAANVAVHEELNAAVAAALR